MLVKIIKEIDDAEIRMQRARLKLSQRELAEKVGTSREKINAIENSRCKKVECELIEKIADEFGLQWQDLLKKEER